MTNPKRQGNGKGAGRTSAWPGAVIVIAVVVLVLLIIWVAKQPKIAANPNGSTNQPSNEVAFSNLKVRPGQGTFNIQGQATNKSKQPITGMTVQVGFDNLSGKTLEKEQTKVKNQDGSDLSVHPIPPNGSAPVLLSVTHVPAGWNQEPPDLTVVNLEHSESNAQGAAADQGSQQQSSGTMGGNGIANAPNPKTPGMAGRGEQPGSAQQSNALKR